MRKKEENKIRALQLGYRKQSSMCPLFSQSPGSALEFSAS